MPLAYLTTRKKPVTAVRNSWAHFCPWPLFFIGQHFTCLFMRASQFPHAWLKTVKAKNGKTISIFWTILEDNVSVHCREEGCIGKYIPRGPRDFPRAWILHPEAREISRGRSPREISRAEGNLSGLGGCISQYIPPLGSVRIQYLRYFTSANMVKKNCVFFYLAIIGKKACILQFFWEVILSSEWSLMGGIFWLFVPLSSKNSFTNRHF